MTEETVLNIKTPFGEINTRLKTFEFVSAHAEPYAIDDHLVHNPIGVLLTSDGKGPLKIARIWDADDDEDLFLDPNTMKGIRAEAKLRTQFALEWVSENQSVLEDRPDA